MKTRKPESRGAARRYGSAGFTLIELLVVITVIMLLATMLMPTVQAIITQGYVARSALMVRRLHDGTLLYKDRTGFLPGEMKDDSSGGIGDPRVAMRSGSLTGSQILAACLFNIEYKDLTSSVDSHDIEASKAYVTYKPEYLINYRNKRNSISDDFPGEKAKPICYFLASNKLADKNELRQFQYTDNRVYMDAQRSSPPLNQRTFETWIESRASGPHEVLNNGGFILIAPGLNRKYLVREVEDPTNPERTIQESDDDDLANDYGGRSK
ncbi:MAG: type II secretion system protein [Phycisphaerae bacterium]|jgi:prepilin-type N-terminal cleavage/methylation domain-containing protein|nr:type II secretion system protein [Phycisphaerae bacterium]